MKLLKTAYFVFFLLFSAAMHAQPIPPPSQNPAPIPGLVWLAAGGAVIVWKKTQKKPD